MGGRAIYLRDDRLLRPLLFLAEPERAHAWALEALRRVDRLGAARAHHRAGALAPLLSNLRGGADQLPPETPVELLGLRFRNPIGLAAGFDKDAVAVAPLMRLGFGFVEAGTVTPRPQPGNPRPRLFRLAEDAAVINRMGFNNGGLDGYVARIATWRARCPPCSAPISASTRKVPTPKRDYPALCRRRAPHAVADYVTVNVSSPNTPGLRDLQGEERLAAILDAIAATAPTCRARRRCWSRSRPTSRMTR